MKVLDNFKYEIFITDSTSSCAGKHLELNVWDCDDDYLIAITQRIVNQLSCANYEIGCIKAESDFLNDSLEQYVTMEDLDNENN